jgi:predicted transcriptional regulator
MRTLLASTLLGASLLACGPLAAEEAGRYTMTPSGDGFVRLDSRTGTVSLCRTEAGELTCKAAADDTARLQSEIERLSDENRALREELEAARTAAAEAQPATGLPSDAEIDKAMTFVEKLVRRFKALVDDLNRPEEKTTPL